MPQAVASTLKLFADDTCLLLHASNPTSLLSTLNLKISFLLQWCNSNKLSINPQTYHLLIIPSTKNSNHMDLSVSLKDTTINAENSVKYLSVIIDTNFNFHDHLRAIELKISRAAEVLYIKIRFTPKCFTNLILFFYSSSPFIWTNRMGLNLPYVSLQSFLSPKQSYQNAW